MDRECDQFDPGVDDEDVMKDCREDGAVLPAREVDYPGLGVLGRGVVGQEGVLADPLADPPLDRPAEVGLAHVQTRVDSVHDRFPAALVTVHHAGLVGV